MDWSSFPFGGVSNYSNDSGHNGERLLSILVTMKYWKDNYLLYITLNYDYVDPKGDEIQLLSSFTRSYCDRPYLALRRNVFK